MYNSSGKLVPIEINTDVSMDRTPIEDPDNIFDLTDLFSFILEKKFEKIVYLGALILFVEKLKNWCNENNIEFEYYHVVGGKTVPHVEDTDDTLIIRSAFDAAALVDTEYCADKVNFLELIKGSEFSHEFAYMNELGELINNIRTIPNYGDEPNFILKSVTPHYNKHQYPKFYKVTNQEELNEILTNVSTDYFLMSMVHNEDKLIDNQKFIIRSYNILYPPELRNISIGHYTQLTGRKLDGVSKYDPNTHELSDDDKIKYLTGSPIRGAKLLDSDLVEMADDSFKSAKDLEVGDMIKTLDIYNPHDTPKNDPCNDFKITYEEFTKGTTYSQNKVTRKRRVDTMTEYVDIEFTDGTNWHDTQSSSYLVLKNGSVQFEMLDPRVGDCKVEIGDQIILVKSEEDNLSTVLKEVKSIKKEKKLFSGWEMTVEEEHVYLTKPEGEESSFVAIEHNVDCPIKLCCDPGCGGCVSPFICCSGVCMALVKCIPCTFA
jgi:hypothetical protein